MIIGLCGKAGSGKNFIADLIEKKYGYVTISFADPLKRICQDIFDFSEEQLWGPSEKRNEPDKRYYRFFRIWGGANRPGESVEDGDVYLTPRFALQTLGTEWGRTCYQNIWVDYTIRTAKKLLDEPGRGYSPTRGLGYLPGAPSAPGVTISDVRFQNEMDGIKAAGGKVVRIERGMTTLTGDSANHSSETEQSAIPDSEFDFILHNVQDLDVLNASLERMMVALAG